MFQVQVEPTTKRRQSSCDIYMKMVTDEALKSFGRVQEGSQVAVENSKNSAIFNFILKN